MGKYIRQFFNLEKQELRLASLSAGYFFLLLCAYYILRPVRETMGISRSAADLPWLFLATMLTLLLLAPLIGALVSRFKRVQLISIAYRFISFNLILFFIALISLPEDYYFNIAVTFYIWLSVINMLVISLFWGFMSDGISLKKSKKLFPVIAIGGTIGAIFGSNIAQHFIHFIGQSYLILIPVILLELAIILVKTIDDNFNQMNLSLAGSSLTSSKNLPQKNEQKPRLFFKVKEWTSGISFSFSSPYVMAISGYIFFYGVTSTFLYFQQGHLIENATASSIRRTQIFANIDLWANLLTLFFQLFITRRLIIALGIGTILIGLPLLTLSGFIALSMAPTLTVLIIFQATRRSLNYGLFKPAREILFTVLPQEQKYKAKSFVDSFVYRGGDATGALIQKGLTALHYGITAITLLVIPIAIIWSLLSVYLGIKIKEVENEHSPQKIKKPDV